MSDIEVNGLTVVNGIERLQECFLFKWLSFDETRTLASICKLINKSDGEIIIEENSPGEGLYLIVNGEVEVFHGEDNTKRTLATLKSGEIFGEMSLIEDMLTSSSVVAVGNIKLLKIGKNDLEKLMDSNDRFAAKIYRCFCFALSERLRKANQKLLKVDTNG
jgi:CRP-like cAMP-binding protein